MRYTAGDPVWVKGGDGLPPGELAGSVTGDYPHWRPGVWYKVTVFGYPAPMDGTDWKVRDDWLRPRRDDYQQHESLGERDQLTRPLADDPLPVTHLLTFEPNPEEASLEHQVRSPSH